MSVDSLCGTCAYWANQNHCFEEGGCNYYPVGLRKRIKVTTEELAEDVRVSKPITNFEAITQSPEALAHWLGVERFGNGRWLDEISDYKYGRTHDAVLDWLNSEEGKEV